MHATFKLVLFFVRKTVELLKFKLAVIETDKFLDSEIERAFLDVEIGSETDIDEIFSVLARHRPKLLEKLKSRYLLNRP